MRSLQEIKVRCTDGSLSPRKTRYNMNHLTSQSTPLVFEPNSIYLLFITQAGRPYPGVFHHNRDNMGRLAYADGGIPGPRRPHRTVFLFELDLKQRIETLFTIITAHKVASLDYHEWLPNPHFVSSKPFVADENKWMGDVLRSLDEEWKRKKLVWTCRPETEPPEFKELAREHTPSVLSWIQAFHIRRLLYGADGPKKRDRDLELYT